uniref:C3H1-type domain-containing protein n=1 Tax=Kalanchoe fedtschenkoi TaxID=63787 RepID=A0A7N0SV60_KALFE
MEASNLEAAAAGVQPDSAMDEGDAIEIVTEESDRVAAEEKTGGEETVPNLTSDRGLGEKRKRDEAAEEENGGAPARHPLWKTSMCSYFRGKSGNCSHGEGCRFAHSEEELQLRPDNTWDPTSERAKKMMKAEDGTGSKVEDEADESVAMTDAFLDDEAGTDPELRKCLVHLPRKWTSDSLKDFLNEQGVKFKYAKKKKNMMVGFLSFENVEQLESALKALDGKLVGNKNLKLANVLPRTFEKKPSNQKNAKLSEHGDDENAGLVPDESNPKARSARDAVTPLAHLSYSEQLETKKTSVMQTLKRLTRNGRKACPTGVTLPDWIVKSREFGGLPCKLEGIIESPIINGYRNKCEFSVGYSLQGKPTVGFMIGNFREGVTAVEEPLSCPNVSEIACKYASIFQQFLEKSSLPLWNRFKNVGFWRQLTVCSTGVDEEIVNKEFERMAQDFVVGAAKNSPSLPLTVLVVQDHTGISNAAPADCPIRSITIPKSEAIPRQELENSAVEHRIHDYINNLKFSISPTAFFQVNTLAAEKLYALAGDWAGLGPDTLLFDVCCGTGTIGLTLAHHVGMVVGIEMNASAILDARKNAEINGIQNCRFVCAKAENVMGSLLKEYFCEPRKGEEVSTGSETHEKEALIVVGQDEATNGAINSKESPAQEQENDKSPSGSLETNGKDTPKESAGTATDGEDTSKRQFKNIVAIVDPPRCGLHPIVIKTLRTHSFLERLVYISCNPESLVANAIELCTPSSTKTEKGHKNNGGWRNMSSAGLARHRAKSMPDSEPFHPVKAMAVDLFPHTPHCEMVMLLER